MSKYHDQAAVEKTCAEIRAMNENEQANMRQLYFQGRNEAKDEVKKISPYTSPEDAEDRRQSLSWYTDVIHKMGWQ